MRWVVTGANRGIGLELVRQLAARGDHVEALARDPSAAGLAELAREHAALIRTHACDVTSDASVDAARRSIGDVAVDVVVNNAGVMGKMQSFEDLDLADAARTIDTNAMGPIRLTRALLPNLLRGQARKVICVTSGMGSITDNTRGGAYGYRMSKAALNMAMKSLSIDFASRGLTVAVINPGWVKTDMGGPGAMIDAATSVSMMLARLDAMTPADNGAFLDYKGGSLPY